MGAQVKGLLLYKQNSEVFFFFVFVLQPLVSTFVRLTILIGFLGSFSASQDLKCAWHRENKVTGVKLSYWVRNSFVAEVLKAII